jgi:hypothetical protein
MDRYIRRDWHIKIDFLYLFKPQHCKTNIAMTNPYDLDDSSHLDDLDDSSHLDDLSSRQDDFDLIGSVEERLCIQIGYGQVRHIKITRTILVS